MAQDKRSAIMFLKAASIILLCGLVSSQDDLACYNLFSKTDANAFLSTGKRSTPRDCCLQSQCGAQGQRCQTEQYRSYICSKKNWDCFMGQICKITLWCPGGYHRDCSDACDALGIPRCMNGGTCLTQGSTWTCTCPAGFTGAVCQTNSVPTAAPTTTTRSPEKRSDIQQIFGPSLQNAIKVGSRVVRGEDWVWGSQDGVPPGPGTVTKIGMGFQNMEVMVTWDAGRSANYRIGATGKYDLYLLA